MTRTQHHVVVADDDQACLQSTTELLCEHGYLCSSATDAASAERRLTSDSCDLLICSVQLPDNGRLDLVRRMPQLAPGVPTVLMAVYPPVELAIEAVRLPVVGWLIKPFAPGELLDAVSLAVRQTALSHVLAGAQARQAEISGQIELLLELCSRPVGNEAAADMRIETFVQLSLGHIVRSLLDLGNLVTGLSADAPERQACQMLACPRTDALLLAMRQTVEVLERTRSSFKSKELGELRRRLQGVLSPQPAAMPTSPRMSHPCGQPTSGAAG